MFENKSENNEKDPATAPLYSASKSGIQKVSINVEDFPVHTMKDDLKDLELGKNPTSSISTRKEAVFGARKPEDMEASPQIRPFKSSIKKDLQPEMNSGRKKIFILATTAIILIIIIAGGYYFWMTRVKDSADIATPQPTNTANVDNQNAANDSAINPRQSATDDAQTLPAFSQSQANYLSVDMQNIDTVGLKEALKEYTAKVSRMNAPGPIEFIITDKMNNPVSFQDFSQKLGVTLSPNVFSYLNHNFSLFIYISNAYPRYGLAIPTNNSNALKTALTQEEKLLAHEIETLFLNPSYSLTNAPAFASSTYNGIQFRYMNIPASNDLSVDYAIFNNKLIIGTSKMTARTILDYLSKSSLAPVR